MFVRVSSKSINYVKTFQAPPHLPYILFYTVMQSDRNSLKTDTFHEPTTYEPYT